MCNCCGQGFFGHNRVDALHNHLQSQPNHNNVRYKDKGITGTDWMKTLNKRLLVRQQNAWCIQSISAFNGFCKKEGAVGFHG